MKLSAVNPRYRSQVIAKLQGKPHTPGRAKARPAHEAGKMNRTEAAYSQWLNGLIHEGVIREWIFEPLKFRLADKTFYTPDFLVIRTDDLIEFHEVKGANRRGPLWEDDARVKIKVAAEAFPLFTFKAVWKIDGQWKTELI